MFGEHSKVLTGRVVDELEGSDEQGTGREPAGGELDRRTQHDCSIEVPEARSCNAHPSVDAPGDGHRTDVVAERHLLVPVLPEGVGIGT